MAVIATLKVAEGRHTPDAYSIASIPLNKLVPWDGNVRRTNAEEGLDELVASIAAHGVLQSLVVRKASRGKYSIVAGRRRFLALLALAEAGTIATDAPVPCRIIPGSTDATEISLTENVMRAPMHPADQYEAFRMLVDSGSTAEEVAARFGITAAAVKKRLKLARVSPTIFEAYRKGDLSLEQIQAFAISDDHTAQERLLGDLTEWNNDPEDIRGALTQDEISLSDKRSRFVGIEAYQAAGGGVRRDLFAEDEEGVFLLDPALLDRLALEKLNAEAETIKAEGWKWVEAAIEADPSEMDYRVKRPERRPLSDEDAAEHKHLSEEYTELFEQSDEPNDETSERLSEIEERIAELEDREQVYSPETLAVTGALVTLDHDGELDVLRGLVKPEDVTTEEDLGETSPKERPEFSAALVKSLTEHKSAALSAVLSGNPDVALAAVVHALATSIFGSSRDKGCLQISASVTRLEATGAAVDAIELANDRWADERIPSDTEACWLWCLKQSRETLLALLAYCAARTVNAVQEKYDRPNEPRLVHSRALSATLGLDMGQWFTPTAENFFKRVGKPTIINAMVAAKGIPAKRSWQKLKKSELAALAARETAGTRWLPEPVRS